MWLMFIKEGGCFERKNIFCTFANGLTFLVGIIVLGVGTYSSIWDIVSTLP
jgi:hypothetical protein